MDPVCIVMTTKHYYRGNPLLLYRRSERAAIGDPRCIVRDCGPRGYRSHLSHRGQNNTCWYGCRISLSIDTQDNVSNLDISICYFNKLCVHTHQQNDDLSAMGRQRGPTGMPIPS
jgi:hypothetical protein